MGPALPVTEGPRHALYQLKSYRLLQNCTKNSIKSDAIRYATSYVLHSFCDITTFTAYVTVYNLKKSFSIDTAFQKKKKMKDKNNKKNKSDTF